MVGEVFVLLLSTVGEDALVREWRWECDGVVGRDEWTRAECLVERRLIACDGETVCSDEGTLE